MGSALPVLSGRKVVRVFESFGWEFARQSASHIILVKKGETVTLSVPDRLQKEHCVVSSVLLGLQLMNSFPLSNADERF